MSAVERKLQIAKMNRQELNAHAYLCEKEQEEYEATMKYQQQRIAELEGQVETLKYDCKKMGELYTKTLTESVQRKLEIERLQGDIEAAEIAIKSYQEQEKHLKAIAELAVKALEHIADSRGTSSHHWIRETFMAKTSLEEIKRISTEGVSQ